MTIGLTKILATIGPASDSPEMLRRLFDAGVEACRLNFSHGSHEEHTIRIARIREISASMGIPISIVMDICGPKVRTENTSYTLTKNEVWTLVPGKSRPGKFEIGIAHPSLHTLVPQGGRILLDDGKFEMVVINVLPHGLQCQVQDSGVLKPRKAVNTPGIDNGLEILSEKDRADLEFAIDKGIDWVAVSFVRHGQDIRRVRDFVESKQWHVPLIAKIETPLAIENLEEIICEADGVMVARGDLGIECPIEDIPVLQKRILRLAQNHGKLSIVATQMLESMIENPRPTRAEVTDVANAVFEGSHVVMLSGETASGKFPLEAVQMMRRTLNHAEQDREPMPHRPQGIGEEGEILWAALSLQAHIKADCVVVICESQSDVSMAASFGGRAPVIAVCRTNAMLRRSNLYYGIQPMLVQGQGHSTEFIARATEQMKVLNIVKAGDRLVFVYHGLTAIKLVRIS